jgi:hypothetical protein
MIQPKDGGRFENAAFAYPLPSQQRDKLENLAGVSADPLGISRSLFDAGRAWLGTKNLRPFIPFL